MRDNYTHEISDALLPPLLDDVTGCVCFAFLGQVCAELRPAVDISCAAPSTVKEIAMA